MKETSSPVETALVLICEKCGKDFDRDGNASKTLARACKERIKDQGLKGEVRVLLTGCMDLCPRKAIAVGLVRTDAPVPPRFFEAAPDEPEESAWRLLSEIIPSRD